jgi:hypothetical protein
MVPAAPEIVFVLRTGTEPVAKTCARALTEFVPIPARARAKKGGTAPRAPGLARAPPGRPVPAPRPRTASGSAFARPDILARTAQANVPRIASDIVGTDFTETENVFVRPEFTELIANSRVTVKMAGSVMMARREPELASAPVDFTESRARKVARWIVVPEFVPEACASALPDIPEPTARFIAPALPERVPALPDPPRALVSPNIQELSATALAPSVPRASTKFPRAPGAKIGYAARAGARALLVSTWPLIVLRRRTLCARIVLRLVAAMKFR